jgi:hypothetical protein
MGGCAFFVKYSQRSQDVPTGFAAFSKVPLSGWAQMVAFAGRGVEMSVDAWSMNVAIQVDEVSASAFSHVSNREQISVHNAKQSTTAA